MELLRFEKLTVYQKSLELVDDLIAIREQAPAGSAEVAHQGERASWSVVLNVAEACGEFSRRDKLKFLRYPATRVHPHSSATSQPRADVGRCA